MPIPQKIHYCWLGGQKMPADNVRCVNSWKKIMPEYELVLWDESRFDITSVAFVEEACRAKKWAFASDYIRIYALHAEGGIYLDTDVYVKRSFNDFLSNDFFSALEYHKKEVEEENAYELLNGDGTLKNPEKDRIFTRGIGMMAAVLGGVKGHPFLKSCLEWYSDKHFILADGTYYDKIISPGIYADVAIEYGFRYKNELQKLKNGMVIYPSSVITDNAEDKTEKTYAIHCCHNSWKERPGEAFLAKMRRKLGRIRILRKILGKKDVYE